MKGSLKVIFQLLYTSTSRDARGAQSDVEILRNAVGRNRRLGIIGYLMRDPGGFCQLLEGPEENVNLLFKNIRRDPRHGHIVQRMSRHVQNRSFKRFTMSYATLDPAEAAWLMRRRDVGNWGVVVPFPSATSRVSIPD